MKKMIPRSLVLQSRVDLIDRKRVGREDADKPGTYILTFSVLKVYAYLDISVGVMVFAVRG